MAERCKVTDDVWDRRCDRDEHPDDLHWNEEPGDVLTWGQRDLVRKRLREGTDG